jgi:hypothetical protein
MKTTKYTLIAALAMVCYVIVLFARQINFEEQRLIAQLEPLKEEGMDKMQATQDVIINPAHQHMLFDLWVCIYFLVIAGLIIFAILRLPKSN